MRTSIPELPREHLTKLGLANVDQYLAWCKEHNFKKTTNKTHEEFWKETEHANKLRAVKVLKTRKVHSPERLLKDFFNKDQKPDLQSAKTDLEKFWGLAKWSGADCDVLRKVCLYLLGQKVNLCERLCDLVRNQDAFDHTILGALPDIVKYKDRWINPIETWKSKTHNVYKNFVSLLNHLFVKYEMPDFMYRVWMPVNRVSEKYADAQKLFLHLATGANLRTFDCHMPLTVTKRIAHLFMQAPSHLTINQAFRYSQFLALGASPEMANVLLSTKLGHFTQREHVLPGSGLRTVMPLEKYQAREAFWETVVQWFVEHPMMDSDQFGPIIDYLENQKFVEQQVYLERGVRHTLPPPQPNLCMKNRDAYPLLRAVTAWHRKLGTTTDRKLSWAFSGFKPLTYVEGEGKEQKLWLIRELLTSGELVAEGRDLRHCVASYDQRCADGRSSIWSLQCRVGEHNTEQPKRVATLEIDINKTSGYYQRIVQARKRNNGKLTDAELKIVKKFANSNGLKVNQFL